MPKEKKKATCHPERWAHGNGMCSSCYSGWHRKNSKQRALCHPDRVHYTKGMCRRCYKKSRYVSSSTEKETRYKHRLRSVYSMTLKEYNTLKRNQDGKCAICRTEVDRLEVDHCHTTGQVRGLLCGPCNRGIGMLQDSVEVLKSAARYLEETI